MLLLPLLVLAAVPTTPPTTPTPPTATTPPAQVEIRNGDLRAVIVQNDAYGVAPADHRAGYNGVAELSHRDGKNLFRSRVAGLNFEHIFSGDAVTFGWDKFEPRRAPMTLRRIGATQVELRQERTLNWPLRTTMNFKVVQGDAIDLAVESVPLEDVWRKNGYVGLFFASYIEAPEDKAIHFIGRSRPGKGDQTPRWISHVPPSHGVAANHRPAGSDWDPPADPGLPLTLVSGHSDHEYLYPFYYGVSHGKVFIMMFDRPNKDGELRFAQSPNGGSDGPHPAWDFLVLQRHYKVGKPFRFRARAVYRDFKDAEDVVKTYEAWSKTRVKRPPAP